MAADRIEADYEVLEQIAGNFTTQSSQIQQMIQLVRSRMNPLESGGWQGRGSEAFFAEMNDEVLPASDRLRVALEEAGATTKQIVQTLTAAEEQAASSFQIR